MFQFGVQPKDGSKTGNTPNTSFSDDKENDKIDKRETTDTDPRTKRVKQEPDPEIKPKSTQSPISITAKKDAPSTPAGRLALPDLIGMADLRNAEQQVSPDERIMWDHEASMIHNAASSYGALRRVKKRARSSSPVSSSPAQASAHFDGKGEAFDLQKLNKSLRTPQADPANELWGRYGLNSKDTTPQAPHLPSLAHVMYTSSPQSSKEPGVLRSETKRSIGRSNSCGTEWPKRRRIGPAEDQHMYDVFAESCNAGPSKLSLVSALLEKVQEGYTSSAIPEEAEDPSHSSPLPSKTTLVKREERSPLRQVTNQSFSSVADTKFTHGSQRSGNGDGARSEPLRVGSPSSDYGDFDDDVFDEDMNEVIERNSVLSSAKVPTPAQPHRQPHVMDTKHHFQPGAMVKDQSKPKLTRDEDDEFGDIDDDSFAVDLENIVAKYDSTAMTNPIASSVPVEAGIGLVDGTSKPSRKDVVPEADSGDEFGDEFSDVDFEAAEAVATQSLQNLASSPPTVRKKFS